MRRGGKESKGAEPDCVMQARGDRCGGGAGVQYIPGRNIRSGGLWFRRGSCQLVVTRVAQNFVISRESGFELTVENGGARGTLPTPPAHSGAILMPCPPSIAHPDLTSECLSAPRPRGNGQPSAMALATSHVQRWAATTRARVISRSSRGWGGPYQCRLG
jgi:hypothetical protein